MAKAGPIPITVGSTPTDLGTRKTIVIWRERTEEGEEGGGSTVNMGHYGAAEPPNKGHYGANNFVLCREVVPISEVK